MRISPALANMHANTRANMHANYSVRCRPHDATACSLAVSKHLHAMPGITEFACPLKATITR
jgi:hypothetical protein